MANLPWCLGRAPTYCRLVLAAVIARNQMLEVIKVEDEKERSRWVEAAEMKYFERVGLKSVKLKISNEGE